MFSLHLLTTSQVPVSFLVLLVTFVSSATSADTKTGSLDLPATPRTQPCEFDSCPADSPAIGADSKHPRLEYVNSYPVTSIKNGISTLGPRFFDGKQPEFAVTGPNVGSNLDFAVPFSGTVGAAVEAVKQGVPAIAFSGRTGSQTAFNATTPLYSKIYADLATNLTTAVLESGTPYLPDGVFLNVNFPSVSATECNETSQFQFVFSRIYAGILSDDDVETCGSTRLPTERDVVDAGCFVSVSPGDASDKTTANATSQAVVLSKLKALLGCLPQNDLYEARKARLTQNARHGEPNTFFDYSIGAERQAEP